MRIAWTYTTTGSPSDSPRSPNMRRKLTAWPSSFRASRRERSSSRSENASRISALSDLVALLMYYKTPFDMIGGMAPVQSYLAPNPTFPEIGPLQRSETGTRRNARLDIMSAVPPSPGAP